MRTAEGMLIEEISIKMNGRDKSKKEIENQEIFIVKYEEEILELNKSMEEFKVIKEELLKESIFEEEIKKVDTEILRITGRIEQVNKYIESAESIIRNMKNKIEQYNEKIQKLQEVRKARYGENAEEIKAAVDEQW